VEICGVEKIDGGLVSIHLSGDVGAVTAAVQAGAQAAQRVGHLVSQHVIPSPHEELVDAFEWGSGQTGATAAEADLERCSVVELRRLARQAPNLPIQGREISRANREQLIRLLREAGLGQTDDSAS
jgi:microcompartment protein CcmL/EutN